MSPHAVAGPRRCGARRCPTLRGTAETGDPVQGVWLRVRSPVRTLHRSPATAGAPAADQAEDEQYRAPRPGDLQREQEEAAEYERQDRAGCRRSGIIRILQFVGIEHRGVSLGRGFQSSGSAGHPAYSPSVPARNSAPQSGFEHRVHAGRTRPMPASARASDPEIVLVERWRAGDARARDILISRTSASCTAWRAGSHRGASLRRPRAGCLGRLPEVPRPVRHRARRGALDVLRAVHHRRAAPLLPRPRRRRAHPAPGLRPAHARHPGGGGADEPRGPVAVDCRASPSTSR